MQKDEKKNQISFAHEKKLHIFATLLRKSNDAEKHWRDGRVVDCGGLENR